MTGYHPRHGRVTFTARAVRVARPVLIVAMILTLTLAGVALLRYGSGSGGSDGSTTATRDPEPAQATPDPTRHAPPRSSSRLIGDRTGDVLELPTLNVRAPLVSVAMNTTGALNPPHDPKQVGYWSASTPPGSHHGQTLVTGHTVHTGGGALDRLGTLTPGARVVIRQTQTSTQPVVYRVTSVRTYSKDQLARSAQQLFGQDHGAGRLQLVTCTGWDGHEYSGNVVVTAVPRGPVDPTVPALGQAGSARVGGSGPSDEHDRAIGITHGPRL